MLAQSRAGNKPFKLPLLRNASAAWDVDANVTGQGCCSDLTNAVPKSTAAGQATLQLSANDGDAAKQQLQQPGSLLSVSHTAITPAAGPAPLPASKHRMLLRTPFLSRSPATTTAATAVTPGNATQVKSSRQHVLTSEPKLSQPGCVPAGSSKDEDSCGRDVTGSNTLLATQVLPRAKRMRLHDVPPRSVLLHKVASPRAADRDTSATDRGAQPAKLPLHAAQQACGAPGACPPADPSTVKNAVAQHTSQHTPAPLCRGHTVSDSSCHSVAHTSGHTDCSLPKQQQDNVTLQSDPSLDSKVAKASTSSHLRAAALPAPLPSSTASTLITANTTEGVPDSPSSHHDAAAAEENLNEKKPEAQLTALHTAAIATEAALPECAEDPEPAAVASDTGTPVAAAPSAAASTPPSVAPSTGAQPALLQVHAPANSMSA